MASSAPQDWQPDSGSYQAEGVDWNVEYKCRPSVFAGDRFELPSDVQFTDMAEMMKGFGQWLLIGPARLRVSLADNDWERRQGLAGVDQLAENEGVLFVFDQPGRYVFWMKGMKFPLDFVWIKDDQVIEVTEKVGLEQMDIRPKQAVDKVLEVNSGFVGRQKLKIGDKVSYESVSD